jgi:MinD superfamily P-loop ATPase
MEPTKSGLHDAERLIELVRTFSIPIYAIINKFDMNLDVSNKIESYLINQAIPLLGKIPFDKKMVEAIVEGKTIVEFCPGSALSEQIETVWKVLSNS